MLWEVDILPKESQDDWRAKTVLSEAAELGISQDFHVRSAHGYLLEGQIHREDATRIATELLVDPVVELRR